MSNIRNFVVGLLLWLVYAPVYAMGPACYKLPPLNRTAQDVLNDLRTVYFKNALESVTSSARFYPSSMTELNGGNVYVLPFYYTPDHNYALNHSGFVIRETEFERSVLQDFSGYTGLNLVHWYYMLSDGSINIIQFFIDEEDFAYIVQNNELIENIFNNFNPRRKLGSIGLKRERKNHLGKLDSFNHNRIAEVKMTTRMFKTADLDVMNLHLSNLSYEAFFVRSLFRSLTETRYSKHPNYDTVLNKKSINNSVPALSLLSLMDKYMLCAKYSTGMSTDMTAKSYLYALSQETVATATMQSYIHALSREIMRLSARNDRRAMSKPSKHSAKNNHQN